MTEEEHRKRHEQLHAAFDELLADFLAQNRGKLPSSTAIVELMKWSYQQTMRPTLLPDEVHDPVK